jgi:hypothetical protein
MLLLFSCPDCGHEHDDPADGSYALSVLCRDCELVAIFESRPVDVPFVTIDVPAAA